MILLWFFLWKVEAFAKPWGSCLALPRTNASNPPPRFSSSQNQQRETVSFISTNIITYTPHFSWYDFRNQPSMHFSWSLFLIVPDSMHAKQTAFSLWSLTNTPPRVWSVNWFYKYLFRFIYIIRNSLWTSTFSYSLHQMS